jgi:predicted DNA-binding ribbon-helix-helix protein
MVAKRHHFVPKCYLESFAIKSNLSSAIRLFVLEFYHSRFPWKPGDETSV